jgi:hypothetical protein
MQCHIYILPCAIYFITCLWYDASGHIHYSFDYTLYDTIHTTMHLCMYTACLLLYHYLQLLTLASMPSALLSVVLSVIILSVVLL